MSIEEPMRKTEQEIMPARISNIHKPAGYDIYPYHPLGDNKVFSGYSSLCDYIAEQKNVVIDGYVGVYWAQLINALREELTARDLHINIIDSASFFKSEKQLDELIMPFLGSEDSVWGKKTTLTLADYFDASAFAEIEENPSADVNIIIGCGASLSNWNASLIYVDLPKNELQHRMSAGSISNLGKNQPEGQMEMYKRFYFADWVVLNKHKKALLNKIDVFLDAQWDEDINWAYGNDIRGGLGKISTSIFRARPWFAPGAWGGQWMKEHMPQLDRNEVNYAWSFELIVPENGIVFESDGLLLEVSFDALMFTNNKKVLGKHAAQFQDEFPIRFDFLDTFDGGNLSIQCHPNLAYIQNEFGETITQDETYYILDCKEDATVYLGFQENINAAEFRESLENSNNNNEEIDIEKFVQVHHAKKHDLFLIPNGTVHSAGAENLVLEISATPYIFTFKMYDWVRLDLNGKPRPINIEHAFKNLDFSRKGDRVQEELISKAAVFFEDKDIICYHLPTHQEHFYDVHRLEFDKEVMVETNNVCHVLMLVEGTAITVESADGTTMTFPFAETFVIPAAASSYKIINQGVERAKVIKAFLK
ncbi:class I mannose-6-phosphate isomerase [Pedobacter lithocola]|uniref:Class I mannose-6-phosphate isomerase n=1 Tax=Pedobacter lithocola TaxID=1908239 RepID=A0ABV8P9N7_9SPHI